MKKLFLLLFLSLAAVSVSAQFPINVAAFKQPAGGGGGGGSLAVDASSEATAQSGNGTLTWSHTVASGGILIVSVHAYAMTVSGVTYNGTSMSSLGSATSGDEYVAMYVLGTPSSGTHDIVASFSGPPGFSYGGATSFTGANTTTPTGTAVTATGSDAAPTVSVSSATGEIVIDAVSWTSLSSSNGTTVGSGQTERWSYTTGSEEINGSGSTEAGASSVTMSWTLAASRNWATIAVAVKPA